MSSPTPAWFSSGNSSENEGDDPPQTPRLASLAALSTLTEGSPLPGRITHLMRQTGRRRTTLTIDDDVLAVAKDLARAERTAAGQVISRVFQQGFEAALTPPDGTPASDIDRRLTVSAVAGATEEHLVVLP